MGATAVQVPLAVVGPDKEASRPAGRIEYRVVGRTDAEGVDKIDRIIAGEMLSEAAALVRPDEFLEDSSHYVGGHLAEVHGFDAPQKSPPGVQGVVRLENQPGCPISRIGHQQRLIIAASLYRLLEEAVEGGQSALRRFHRGR